MLSNVSDMGIATSSGAGGSIGSRRSATFTPDTIFPQVYNNSARNSKRKSKEKKIVHDVQSVVKFDLKIPVSDDNQKLLMDRFGDLIRVL